MPYRKSILLPLLVAALHPCFVMADDVVAYTGATIETVGKAGTIQNGTVVVRNGKIDAVGVKVRIPTSAQVVDVTGQTMMPALVNVYLPVSAGGGSSAPATRTITIGGRTFTIGGGGTTTSTAFVKLSDNVDPLSLKSDLKRQARYGVGLVNVVTRGYGQAMTANVTPANAEGSVVNKDGCLFLAVTNSTTSLDVLRKGLKGSTSSTRSRTTSTSSSSSRSTTSSSTTELWKSVKDGKTPIVVNANSAATITYVLKIQKEYDKVKLVLIASGQNIFQTLNQLKDRNVSVLLKAGLDIAPRSSQRINVPKLLADAGITFGFSASLDTSLTSMPDTPLFPVAMLVKTGLPRSEALKALTLNPATMLGLEKTHGSIETGKQANLMFFDGDPLTAASQLQHVLVEGKSVYEN